MNPWCKTVLLSCGIPKLFAIEKLLRYLPAFKKEQKKKSEAAFSATSFESKEGSLESGEVESRWNKKSGITTLVPTPVSKKGSLESEKVESGCSGIKNQASPPWKTPCIGTAQVFEAFPFRE